MGVLHLLIFLYDASINTFLDLALDFLNLFLRSGVGRRSHRVFSNPGFSFRSIWTSLLHDRGDGKAPDISSYVRSTFFGQG